MVPVSVSPMRAFYPMRVEDATPVAQAASLWLCSRQGCLLHGTVAKAASLWRAHGLAACATGKGRLTEQLTCYCLEAGICLATTAPQGEPSCPSPVPGSRRCPP